MSSKSANYCFANQNNHVGLLLLCEVSTFALFCGQIKCMKRRFTEVVVCTPHHIFKITDSVEEKRYSVCTLDLSSSKMYLTEKGNILSPLSYFEGLSIC